MMSRKRLWLFLAALLAVLLAAPFLVPQSLILPQLQLFASRQLGEPVRVAGARIFLLPLPRVTLTHVIVGAKPFLEIDSITVAPKLSTLLSGEKTIETVTLTGITARQALMPRIEKWTQSQQHDSPATVRIETIALRGIDLALDSLKLSAIDADIELGAGNVLHSATLRVDKNHLLVFVTPGGRHHAVKLSARNWILPGPLPLHIETLDSTGKLTPDSMTLPAMRGAIYGGTFQGKAFLDWKRDWRLSGAAQVKQVEVSNIAAMYSNEIGISGRLDARSTFNLQAPLASQLADAPEVEVDFEVHDGVLHKIDLAAAATLIPGKESGKAGQTRFNRFSGHLTVNSRGFHFTGLQISSGVLSATGYVSISPKRELSGRIETALKGTGSLVGTPVAISGTVDSPVVRPTKGTLAGAAAGTVLLGPGVGTTIGMKAGQLTERLFGKKPPKPGDPKGPAQNGASENKPTGPSGGR